MQRAQIPSDPSSPGEMFSNRTNSKKKPYLVYLSLHLFLHLLSLFMWRIKGIYSPGGGECAISRGMRKVPFSATIYVPPEQPKQLHFLNPNATGDLTLQS